WPIVSSAKSGRSGTGLGYRVRGCAAIRTLSRRPPLACAGGLLGRARAGRGRTARRSAAADASALARGGVARRLAAARAALLAAAGLLVDRGPGAPLGLAPADAALLVAFLDVLGLALLLAGIARLIPAGHAHLLCTLTMEVNARSGVGF